MRVYGHCLMRSRRLLLKSTTAVRCRGGNINKIAQYEAAKRELQRKGLSPEQYEKKLRELAKKLKI